MTRPAGTATAPRRQRGVSMVEIPIALLILAILLVLAVRTFSTAGTVQRDAHMVNQATAYGIAKLHHLEAFPRERLGTGQDTAMNADGKIFSRAWTVTDRPACKEVSVTVSWKSASRTESLTMATLIR